MGLLVGDVGGTSTRLARADVRDDGTVVLTDERRYASASAASLDALVARYFTETDARFERACFAVAGPVRDRRCVTTNLPWLLDEAALAASLDLASVTLVNDFAAAAWGTLAIAPSHAEVLQAGPTDPHGTRVVLGAGTGLGEALVVASPSGPVVVPGEGGHKGFAARDARGDRLLAFLRAEVGGRVSVERVVSGLGLRDIYRFLRDVETMPESASVRARLATSDPGEVIGAAALADDDALCAAALDVFLDAYGAEAGDLALQVLPAGGVWIAGGIAAKILPRMKSGPFLSAFRDKGRMRSIVEGVALYVVTDPSLGLRGAARAAG